MATRATPKPTMKKRPAGKGPDDSSPSKSAAGQKSKPAAEETPPAPPKAPVETVSLIEPKQKTVRRAPETDAPSRPVLPPISRIRNPEPVKTEAPAPAAAVSETEPSEETSSEPGIEEKIIHIKPPIIVKELAAQLGMKPFQLIHDLMEMNIFAAINQTIEPEVATVICKKHGFIFEKEKREKGGGVHKVEAVIEPPPPPVIEKEDELALRAPIITFMGHVDHGKTSLMDAIRKTRVAAGEAGGITQHIGAYSVNYNGHQITFLDTPGHAAFTAMRARGANVTDIVVLVVAADDGLMPQTLEAISHAKAAKVSIIVAINKIDLASANIDKVKGQLQEQGLAPEDWGGETIVCPVSATKGTGIDHLLEMLLLQSEVLELKASAQASPRGTVIEAQIEAGRGPTATVIVRMGTLKIGDAFICGNYWGKVKSLIDDLGKPIKSAGPSTPVKVLGFSGLPNAGDEFLVMESDRSARALSEERLDSLRKEKLSVPQRATLENLFESLAEGQRKVLNIVLKCDVQGSMEALIASLKQIASKKIDLNIIHSAVGPITDSDILLATASNAVVAGFNVKVENSASGAAKREGVQIKLFSIIYELIDQIKEAMTGMLDPELRETVIGHAEVKQVFELSKGIVAGCYVTDGRISRTARARVLRRRQPIYDGGIATLRRFQDDVKEVRSGLECGIKLGDYTEYQPEDIIECYQLEKVAQKL
jgi:translation initiation factor IF-2